MSLRRIIHSHDEGIFAAVTPLVWMPKHGRQEGTLCPLCAAAYGKDAAWFTEYTGTEEAGPRCETCDHVVKSDGLVEDSRTHVKILCKCHGDEELHVVDLGSETWRESAAAPGDEFELVRRFMMTHRHFVPTRQGEKPVVGGGGT